MRGKAFIIPILIIALLGFVSAPPAEAELATVTAILVAGFVTTALIVESVEYVEEEQEAAQSDMDKSKPERPQPEAEPKAETGSS